MTPAAAFKAAIESNDIDAAVALFSEDCTFNSPVVHKPYEGREALSVILHAVSTVFENFRYDGEFAAADGHTLLFSAQIGDRQLQGVDILRVEANQIVEFTVMIRPYSAATALRDRMAELLA